MRYVKLRWTRLLESNFMCFYHVYWYRVKVDGRNELRKLQHQRGNTELLGYSTSTSMLNIKTLRSFTIVSRIKRISRVSGSFTISFAPVGREACAYFRSSRWISSLQTLICCKKNQSESHIRLWSSSFFINLLATRQWFITNHCSVKFFIPSTNCCIIEPVGL